MYLTRGYPIDLELRRAYRARRRPRRPILSALLQRLRPPSPASERAPRAPAPKRSEPCRPHRQSARSACRSVDAGPERPPGAPLAADLELDPPLAVRSLIDPRA